MGAIVAGVVANDFVVETGVGFVEKNRTTFSMWILLCYLATDALLANVGDVGVDLRGILLLLSGWFGWTTGWIKPQHKVEEENVENYRKKTVEAACLYSLDRLICWES